MKRLHVTEERDYSAKELVEMATDESIEDLCRKQKTCIDRSGCRLNHESVKECLAWEESIGAPQYDANAPQREEELVF